ncbi:hypothetical protein [Burkholderia multivorans]|uniref:hypothetical protein n=1 Tax=Burkholderia multivorans TaxID=87883 RepID=UPI0011B221E9|nr:hypothetical protein [Burkholderia multivorans]
MMKLATVGRSSVVIGAFGVALSAARKAVVRRMRAARHARRSVFGRIDRARAAAHLRMSLVGPPALRALWSGIPIACARAFGLKMRIALSIEAPQALFGLRS